MEIAKLERLRQTINTLPRFWKRVILVAADFAALAFSVWAAYSLRLNIIYPPGPMQWLVILSAPVVAIPVFIRFGLYRSVIRYLPERAFWTIANAVVIATLLWVGLLFAMEVSRMGTVPRSLPAIYCVLAIFLTGGSRFAAKYVLWTPLYRQYSGQVLIYGAGTAGAQLAYALRREGHKLVLGFIDDDPSLQGRDVSGIRVYAPSHIDQLKETTGVSEIILSIPSAGAERRQQIIAELSRHHLKIRALPSLNDLASGRYLVSQIREIDIGDILGRSSVPPDPALLERMIRDRVILVSGAGGSIGSELCKLIVKWKPRKLVLLEANEFALYQIERELAKRSDLPVVPTLGSVTNASLVGRVLKSEGVQVVFHAAAHKHVPLVEANAVEGVRNNVFGTKTIAGAAFEAGVEQFVLISTDKAVRPSNVMGATKRWAELIVRSYAQRATDEGRPQRFCSVRFGNVLGSKGSVVPLFEEQIAQGGPLTVTDEAMTRYFMSIREAAELIVQAGAMAQGGDTFLLDMGEPMRIRTLAENMVHLAGLSIKGPDNPAGDIAIEIIGRRPGEKLHEELFYDPDTAQATDHPKILRAPRRGGTAPQLEERHLAEMTAAVEQDDEPGVRRLLFSLVEAGDAPGSAQVVPIGTARQR